MKKVRGRSSSTVRPVSRWMWRGIAVRLVTMTGVVSTVTGNGEKGFADGEGEAARFNQPIGIVVDRQGAITVADNDNNRLRKIV